MRIKTRPHGVQDLIVIQMLIGHSKTVGVMQSAGAGSKQGKGEQNLKKEQSDSATAVED